MNNPHEDNCATCGEVLCSGIVESFCYKMTKSFKLTEAIMLPFTLHCKGKVCWSDIYEDDNGRWFHNDCLVADLDDYDTMIPAEE